MKSPARILRLLFALIGYSSVHWAAGRWRRALVWDALLLALLALVFYLPTWLLFPLFFAQVVDAALIKPTTSRSTGMYAVAMLVAFCSYQLVAVTVRHVWAETFKIPSGAMIPTLQVGDHIWVARYVRTPQRGDATVFIYPKEPDKDFIKRVVAVGGDTLEIRDGVLVLNGAPVPRVHVDGPCEYDDYVEESERWEQRGCDAWDETLGGHTYRIYFDSTGGYTRSFGPTTVPPGHYFVMGDNRDNSHDSRFWGFVPPENIKGVARKVWWSYGPAGIRWDRIDQPVR